MANSVSNATGAWHVAHIIEQDLLSLEETRDLIDHAMLTVETRDHHENWQTPDRKAAGRAASQHPEALWQLVGSGS